MIQTTKTITLADSREITIDLNKITVTEWRQLFDKNQSQENEDMVLAKASGLSIEEYQSLGMGNWKLLSKSILTFAFEYSRQLFDEKDDTENPT